MRENKYSQTWWLVPVILATQETEIGRIMVPGLAWAKNLQDLMSTNDWVW
jgi:hypothetical protein